MSKITIEVVIVDKDNTSSANENKDLSTADSGEAGNSDESKQSSSEDANDESDS